MGGVSAPSLKGIKGKLDEIDRSGRRVSLSAFHLDYGMREFRPVTVTLIAGKDECWITNGADRSKVYIKNLAPPSAKDALTEYFRLKEAATLADKATRAALEAIPRLTEADLRAHPAQAAT
jgi:hypothetical protein